MSFTDMRYEDDDFDMVAGDTLVITKTFVTSAGAAVDMSGTWTGAIKRDRHDEGTLATLTVGTGSAASGIVTFTLSATDSAAALLQGRPEATVYWEGKRVASGATRRWCGGRIKIRAAVA